MAFRRRRIRREKAAHHSVSELSKLPLHQVTLLGKALKLLLGGFVLLFCLRK